jgi:hypothetical protein
MATASVALHNACLERLHALKSQFDSSYEPLIQLLVAQHGAVDAPVAPPAAQNVAIPAGQLPPTPTASESLPITPGTPATTPRANVADLYSIIGRLPQKYHSKYTRLHTYLTEHPRVIGESSDGQLVVGGKVIANSTYADVIRELYAPSRGESGYAPPGLTELLHAFNSVDVPASLISSSKVRQQYFAIQARDNQEVVDGPYYSIRRPQSGSGQKISAIQNEMRGYKSFIKPTKMHPGHTSYSNVHSDTEFQSDRQRLVPPPKTVHFAGIKRQHQSGRGQTISSAVNEKRGYERFDPAKKKKTTHAPAPLPPGHTPYSWMHAMEQGEHRQNTAKHEQQSGNGHVDSPCFPGREIKALRLY